MTAQPTLFDLDTPTRAVVVEPAGDRFVPAEKRLCGICRKPMKTQPHTHLCGSANAEGSYVLCDPCAATDVFPEGHPSAGQPRWGFTTRHLEIDAIRRRIYAAGGGETEVAAELARTQGGAA